MQTIYALTDYKDHFGSKWGSKPYRSGYDKKYLRDLFKIENYELEYVQFKDVDLSLDWSNSIVIYTSSEEVGLKYKDFIEDVILSLEKAGANVIPGYEYLRANNNKVYMELMRNRVLREEISGINSFVYGSIEELYDDLEQGKIELPVVVKKAAGAMSKDVYLASTKEELFKIVKKVARTRNVMLEWKELIRQKKHKGYKAESKYQNKFILQTFIPNLSNDWKILIYGDRYYILKRGIKKNDFRASGSHYNYLAGSKSGFPLEMLDTVERIFYKLNIPNVSIDFAYDGYNGYLFELQAIHFGTSTLAYSDDFFTKKAGRWVTEKKINDEEQEYVYSIVRFLKRNA